MMLMMLAGMSASAATIDELTSFLYEGRSYVPLKSTANFLGAPLRWDADKGQSVFTYKGDDLTLTPNSRKAFYAGEPVLLTSRSVVIDGVTYVPVDTFKRFYNVPVTWDQARSEVKIKGPKGWRTMKASNRPPWHGGPPPWAPAWGRRGYGTPGRGDGKVNAHENDKVNRPAVVRKAQGAPGHRGDGKVTGHRNDKVNRLAVVKKSQGAPIHPGNSDGNRNRKMKDN